MNLGNSPLIAIDVEESAEGLPLVQISAYVREVGAEIELEGRCEAIGG